jgi:hypothetical protein
MNKLDWNELASSQNPHLEICAECGDTCTGRLEDNGVGPYEFHGQRGTHHLWEYQSDCCGAAVLKDGRQYYGPEEDSGDEGDRLYQQAKEEEEW